MAVRVAVIGTGHIGLQHAAAYRTSEDAELVAVCDLLPERAESAGRDLDVAHYTSIEALFRDRQIDAVSIATAGAQNGSHHFGPVIQCMQAGKHVLCEKPLSNHVAEARAMVQKAKQVGICFGCDLNHRFTPQADAAHGWVRDGLLGEVQLANVTLWIDNPADRSPWFHMRALHPHSFDVMRFYCGRAVRVQAFFNRAHSASQPDGKRVCWSNAQVNVLFESGAIGHLTGSYDANMDLNFERCEVMGDKGRFVIDNCYERATLYTRGSAELKVLPNGLFSGVQGFDSTITRRVHHWAAQLNAGVPPDKIDASGEDGLAVQEIIEGAITSWDTGAPVDIENG